MRTRLLQLWRTWAYLFLSLVGADRLRRLKANRGLRVLLLLIDRRLRRGYIEVRGGPAFGLKLDGSHLAVDHQQAYGLVRGTLETDVQEALRRHVNPGAVVFDVGANLGFFSLLSARLAGPNGRVDAFEPVPESAAGLRRSATLNGLITLRVHQRAVADYAGPASMWLPRERSWAHLVERGQQPDESVRLDVRAIVLDDEILAGRLPVPSVIKIDVEGSEVQVLTGLRNTLTVSRPIIVCELHGTYEQVRAVADELGYAVQNLEGPGPIGRDDHARVLLTPR